MTRGAAVLKQLTRGERVTERVLIVTAHPDDETLSLGGSLGLFDAALIVQLTDGAIDDPDAWTKAGVSSRADYATLRARERKAAFLAAGWHLATLDVGITDQETRASLGALLAATVAALAPVAVVFTHAYEGGHPDHDSAAFVVQEACARLAQPPERLEFASYHWDGVTRRAGVFWPVDGHAVVTVELRGDRLTRKQAALACYASQASVTRWFPVSREAYRIAPTYDFSLAPSTPGCWYDRKAWKTTSAQWRTSAAAAMAGQAVSA